MPTPLLKILILVLFIAVLASLSSALMFLFKDHETGRKRTLYALGLRITLAIALMGLVGYGLQTGQLTLGARPGTGPLKTDRRRRNATPAARLKRYKRK